MKKTGFGIILLLCLSGVFLACHKDKPTVVNGHIVDKVTQLPLAGVGVGLRYQNDKGDYVDAIAVTDSEGNFRYENSIFFGIFNVYKKGYLTKGPGFIQIPLTVGEENTITIEMVPLDGILRLEVENVTGQHDSIYFLIYSPTLDAESPFSNGIIQFEKPTLPFSIGDGYLKDIPVVAEDPLLIHWGFIANQVSASLLQATVIVSRNDTTSYKITF